VELCYEAEKCAPHAGLPGFQGTRAIRRDREEKCVVDDKVLEEISFHQDVVEHGGDSPLHRIREKEMEISGKVLAAKRQADEIVADARRKASEVVAKGEAEAAESARAAEAAATAKAEKDAAEIRENAVAEAAALEEALATRRDMAAEAIVQVVTKV
jgi:vacuolar-type H+-ATPase subunit H